MKTDMLDRRKSIKERMQHFDNYKLILEAENALRRSILAVNKRALELTKLNAIENSGPVEIQDYIDELLISQQKIDNYYSKNQNEVRQLTIEDFEKE